ncbi:PepSY-associated TM helix domain-containing protein [Mycolicibacterium sp. 22603]|uniref:PepSY-associated TM helix domain-containing protein n=1 Tax=Mycolicibacterium sp. 22603 TaxID=3453950 RepID=UPI003F867BBE
MTIPDDTVDIDPTDTTPPPTTTARRSWRPFVVRLHFYAGILIAPFILIAAMTGGLYAMAPTIERIIYADILTVTPAGQALPLAEQVAAAQQAFPALTVTGMRPPAAADASTRVEFADPTLDPELLRSVFVDPYTGRVLGDEVTWLGYLPVSTWLDSFHRHLQLGEPGRVYSELAASWLWVVALGGLALWLSRAAAQRRQGRPGRILRVDRSTKGRARTMNWHGATGVWLLAGLLFLSATGITWSTYAGEHVTELRSAMNWKRPVLDTTLQPAAAVAGAHTGHGEHGGHGEHAAGMSGTPAGAIDYDAVLQAAATAGVQQPVELALPTEAGNGVRVAELDKPYRLTTNVASVDPVTNTVSSEIDYWRDYSVVAMLADWGIRGHMGLLFGPANQLILLGVAVALVAVIIGGYRMWWQRRPTRGSRWAVGRPPLRTTWKRLPPWAIGTTIVAAVAIGWCLPLLGLSLAGFVLVDVLVGAAKARKENADA